MNKLTREAKTALVAAMDALVAYDRDKLAKAVVEAAARKKLARYQVPATYQRGDSPELTSMASVTVGWYGGGDKPTEKSLAESVLAGTTKVDYGAGTPRNVKTLAPILRQMTKPDAAKLRRLDTRIEALRKERIDHIATAHQRGIAFTTEYLAKHVARLRTIKSSIGHGYGGDRDWDRERLELAAVRANAHLEHIADPTREPCEECVRQVQRDEAVRLQAEREAERIAALPKAKVKNCPCGKGHIVPIDRRLARFDDRTIEKAPTFICPKTGTLYVHAAILAKEDAAAAKAKRKTTLVTFLCPNDGEAEESEVEHANGARWVECESCEQAFRLDAVKLVKTRKEAA